MYITSVLSFTMPPDWVKTVLVKRSYQSSVSYSQRDKICSCEDRVDKNKQNSFYGSTLYLLKIVFNDIDHMVIEAVEAKYNTWPQEYILILS